MGYRKNQQWNDCVRSKHKHAYSLNKHHNEISSGILTRKVEIIKALVNSGLYETEDKIEMVAFRLNKFFS